MPLNAGIKLKDGFASLAVKVLGTLIQTITTTENKELFARAIYDINEHCACLESANNLKEALHTAHCCCNISISISISISIISIII